ncbi:bifunctional polynucleotide phosphatase/kinase-like isoform X2 [Littorina saxatilis]|uniref:bifunctional polynucleotide phosphatase/kinase-like isoform X2 n=1 Tax=Littorina saxatilis TaxID=31220 RepID=UPI0038B5E0B5
MQPGSNDWEWWDNRVPDKLRQLHKDGFRVLFITNQAGIEKDKVKPQTVKDKLEAIIKELGIPVQVLISTGNSHYRKPSPCMWDFFVKDCNQGVAVNKAESYYVGDAAGRAKEWAPGKPKDFSCSDRMFAANIGISFYTPEEFFLGEKPAKFEWRSIDPKNYVTGAAKPAAKQEYHKKGQELVIMVGCPASGKSMFTKRFFVPHGYLTVNRDKLKTAKKCLKVAKESLKAGTSVVVDNTNPAASARAPFVAAAKAAGVPCRCLWMQTPLELAHHLNLVRQNQTNGESRRVPNVGYNVFKKNFEEPTKAEGFSEVTKLDFVPKFDSKRDEKIFKQWTT